MQTENDKIKDIFSSRLSKFEPTVPNDIWEKIEDSLPKETIAPIRAKKVSLYRQIAAVASIAILVVSLSLLFFDQKDQTAAKQIASSFNIEELNPNYQPKETEVEVPHRNDILSQSSTVHKHYSVLIPTKNTDKKPTTDKNDSQEEVKNQQAKSNRTDKEDPDLKKKIEEFANQGSKNISTEQYTSETSTKKQGFTLSLGGHTGFYNSDERSKVKSSLRKFMESNSNITTQNEMMNVYEKYFNDIPVKIDHNQPISFGLMASKNINKNLSIESGIVYTYLSSKIRSESKSLVKRIDRQYFHYLGVPVNINYTFASWGKAEFYASAGAMIQKDIQGRYKEEQDVESKTEQSSVTGKESIHQSNPQFSVSGKLGAAYPIYDKLYIYTTVGGAYYIDANNKYRTIYSDKKLQLDLNLGLKLKF